MTAGAGALVLAGAVAANGCPDTHRICREVPQTVVKGLEPDKNKECKTPDDWRFRETFFRKGTVYYCGKRHEKKAKQIAQNGPQKKVCIDVNKKTCPDNPPVCPNDEKPVYDIDGKRWKNECVFYLNPDDVQENVRSYLNALLQKKLGTTTAAAIINTNNKPNNRQYG